MWSYFHVVTMQVSCFLVAKLASTCQLCTITKGIMPTFYIQNYFIDAVCITKEMANFSNKISSAIFAAMLLKAEKKH